MLIGLARVSTSEQSLSLQIDCLHKAGCEKIFTEEVSGSKASRERPGLREAIEFGRRGDVLVCYRLDRISRSFRELFNTIEELDAKGIALRSLTENLENESPSGKMTFRLFAILNEWELDVLKSRTLAGLAAARARGKVGGRPRSLTDAKVDMAKGLLAAGKLTISEIATELQVAPSTLYRHLPAARSSSLETA